MAFDPTGQTLASGSGDKTVKLWEPASGKLLRTLEGHTETVCSVAFDPTGQTLASGSDDNTVKLWEPASGKLLRTLEGHTDACRLRRLFSQMASCWRPRATIDTVRAVALRTWETVAVIPEPTIVS